MKNTHRRIAALTLALVLIISTLGVLPSTAFATANINGSTNSTTTFFVTASSSSSYIELYSYKGVAYVADYVPNHDDPWNDRLVGYESDSYHGFYYVHVTGGSYSKTYYWVPSASFNLYLNDFYDQVRNTKTLKIPFPQGDTYKIQVEPMSADSASSYWHYDRLMYWINDATWELSKEKSCTSSYNNPNRYERGVFTVECYDSTSRSTIMSYSVEIHGTQTVKPQSIDGYKLTSSTAGVKVTVDSQTGICSPSSITFTYSKLPGTARVKVICEDIYGYRIGSEYYVTISKSQIIYPKSIDGYQKVSDGQQVYFNPAKDSDCRPSTITFVYKKEGQKPSPNPPPTPKPDPRPNPNPVPTSWDTKYRPGVSDKNPNGINNLSKLTDGNAGTVFAYTLYNSDKKNGLPDFTANFNGSSVSGIKIRNGDGGDYYRYMRINTFYVKVYTNSGSYTESTMTVPDSPSSDYYSFSFRQRYSGVTRIEIYITDRHTGSGEDTNRVRIRDIAFY